MWQLETIEIVIIDFNKEKCLWVLVKWTVVILFQKWIKKIKNKQINNMRENNFY